VLVSFAISSSNRNHRLGSRCADRGPWALQWPQNDAAGRKRCPCSGAGRVRHSCASKLVARSVREPFCRAPGAPDELEQQMVLLEAHSLPLPQKRSRSKWAARQIPRQATELEDIPRADREARSAELDGQTPRIKNVERLWAQIAQAGKAFVIVLAFYIGRSASSTSLGSSWRWDRHSGSGRRND